MVEQDGGVGSKFHFLSFLLQWKDLDMFLVLWEGACGEDRLKKQQKQSLGEKQTGVERWQLMEVYIWRWEKTGKDGVTGKADFLDCLISTLELPET